MSECNVRAFFILAGPLHIYYGFLFYVFMDFRACECVGLCIYMCYLSFFFGSVFYCLFVVFSYSNFLNFIYFLFRFSVCILMRERKTFWWSNGEDLEGIVEGKT